jgi:hypothetical protein
MAKPEGRDGHADECDAGQRAIDPSSRACRAPETGRNGEEDAQQQRRSGEQRGVGEPFGDGAPVGDLVQKAPAQVTAGQASQPEPVLDGQRPVQPQPLLDGGALLERQLGVRENGGAARREMHEAEGHGADDEHHRDRVAGPAHQEGDHGAA